MQEQHLPLRKTDRPQPEAQGGAARERNRTSRAFRGMNYTTMAPYRPAGLRAHNQCMHFYDADDLITEFGAEAAAEARRRAAEPADEQNKKPDGYWYRLIAEIERRT